MQGWRSFNYHFVVVYTPDREAEVLALLGSHADETAANRSAYELASEEIFTLQGQDQFFAWYNQGSSLVRLQDFSGAAAAYDQAFSLLAELPGDKRPWRATWYITGRYYDVMALADKTIGGASEPYLEESFYWRARAKATLGDTTGAVEDLRKSLEYHPNFNPSVALMAELGAAP
jgi:tetratricopeptide (TPR) repeat protein